MIIPPNIFVNNDTAYIVIETQPVSKFCESGSADPRMDIVKCYRDWCSADHVLKQNDRFLFCETIRDAEVINEDTGSAVNE
jgi:hypothetical protein